MYQKFLKETVSALRLHAEELAQELGLQTGEVYSPQLNAHAGVSADFLTTRWYDLDLRRHLGFALYFAGVSNSVDKVRELDLENVRNSLAFQAVSTFADERAEIWNMLYIFVTKRRERVIGIHKGIRIYRIFSLEHMPEQESERDAELLELTRLYIDAAFSLKDDFSATGFNADYGWNNLPYLRGEFYGEPGQENHVPTLYRVFTAFSGEDPKVFEAHEIALMRAIMPPAETDYAITETVQKLLDWPGQEY